jgi:putative ABC transport system permease protein
MQRLAELGRRLATLRRGERFDRELQEEMRLHRELREEQRAREGMPQRSARAAAAQKFGNEIELRERSGDIWRRRMLENFLQDLRYGVRALLRTPGFTAVAVLTLALGIGANAAIFSVVNAVLLRPLPYQDAGRLVTVLHDGIDPVAVANYFDWRDQSTSFEAMAAADYWTPNLTNSDPPEHLWGLQVTQNLLPMLGVDPILGRWFAPGEDKVGGEHEVILSARLWRRRFNNDPAILGKIITLNGEGYTVVGIMPADFKFAPFWATRAELWVPNALGDRSTDRGGNHLRVFARLKQGVTLQLARAEIAGITARLEKQFPGTNRRVMVTPLKENVVGDVRGPLLVLLGAVAFVLLIACANVAHMLLARTSDRQKEIAVRTALGAGRGRMVRQFLTENLLLASAGAAAGILLAFWAIRSLVALAPAYLPRVDTVRIDSRAILFVIGITALTPLLFGMAPAVQGTAGGLSGALKEGTRGGSDGVSRGRMRSLLMASEFALAFMLLIGAGLMIRSFSALESLDPGFNPRNVLSMIVSVAGAKEAEPGQRAVFYPQLLEKIRALPGVLSTGGINHLPLAGDSWGWPFSIEGRPKPLPGESPNGVYRIVMPGYFATMQLPILRGRGISPQDDARAPGIVVINERAAARYWPGEDPIGKRITFDDEDVKPRKWLTIAGIAKNAKQEEWAAKIVPETYISALQTKSFMESTGSHYAYITVVIRTSGDPAAMVNAVKNTVWSMDNNLPISEVLKMSEVVKEANAQPRFEMLLLGVFGGVALLLAAVGIYGVMNYAVARRTREIGIRMSLGATRAQMLRMVLTQGMKQALVGGMIGFAGALMLARLMGKMLYGVRPTDPLTFCGVAIVLGAAATAAICVPARRATHIEPIVALRHE